MAHQRPVTILQHPFEACNNQHAAITGAGHDDVPFFSIYEHAPDQISCYYYC
jgi:hypothetical protein